MTNSHPPRVLTLTTAPASEPLTLAETKLFLRVDGDEEDTVISNLITSARETAESWLRKSLVTQSWQLDQQFVAGEPVQLALGPVQSVTEVSIAQDGQTTVLTTSQYELDVAREKITLAGSLYAERVSVTFVAGYGDASDVPAAIRQGMLHQITHLYHHREDGKGIAAQTEALWSEYRERRI